MFIIFTVICPPSSAGEKNIILATTTSTQDSGLSDVLIPLFEKKYGYFVKTIAIGSGQAIRMGMKGEADVLLIHSPEEEEKFVSEGFGINRRPIMYNDFVLVGPPSDPAKIIGTGSVVKAFRKIAESKSIFISRGDNSGTNIKERALWRQGGVKYEGERWYHESGLGMGQTLNIASEKRAYTLSDRATYITLKKRLDLTLLFEGDRLLLNPYHVIEVNPLRFPKVNKAGARAFSDFLSSKEAQSIIKVFGVDRFGQPLFFPAAPKKQKGLER
ncbi:MAG: substrate-binding domain-containing protein [Syntrophorhabdaceae bacterium]|nr:substrate-binding domain-containing protein [Syntrophorhabdaceae bacterium]